MESRHVRVGALGDQTWRHADLQLAPDDVALRLDGTEQQLLQAVVLISCSASFIGLCFILLHYAWERWARRICQRRGRGSSIIFPRDFNAKLVFVLCAIDLFTILARMIGRAGLHSESLCQLQAAVLHAGGLASGLWTTCISFNLYRWIVFGESERKRRSRFAVYVCGTIVPSLVLILYPLREHKYGNATFYCFLKTPTLMFVHFYSLYSIIAVVNISFLILIRINLNRRVLWHDTAEADLTSNVIRKKAMLYIIIFIGHRIPIFLYRVLEASGFQIFVVGVIVQLILNLDGFSTAVVYGGLCQKFPRKDAPSDDGAVEQETYLPQFNSDNSGETEDYMAKRQKNGVLPVVPEELERMTESVASTATSMAAMTQPTTMLPVHAPLTGAVFASIGGSNTRSADANGTSPRDASTSDVTKSISKDKKRRFAAGILERTSLDSSTDSFKRSRGKQTTQRSFSVFVSTFNMGEQNIDESELVEWIPIGHEIYVIGVQECMNLSDLQSKISQHLTCNTKQRYIHFSREIGKRATALGYHGYIALTVFVLEEAVLEGRFEMPQRESLSKHAQEVFRGKSLLLFGRASNKGAVGMSFRYGNTSFAFVTCHLASDSSSSISSKKLSFRSAKLGEKVGDGSDADLSEKEAVDRFAERFQTKPPPSKVERRNQDAMEILQQLYLDEEDHGFGFPLIHHHSFILGDLNYRMSRKTLTPSQMLDQFSQVGSFKAALANRRSSQRRQFDVYNELTTPTTMKLVPDFPQALESLIREHDELTMLREKAQLFYGFEEPQITFFPTFRRIRGQALESYDIETLSRNYSLIAKGGGYRVPSYTDRVLHTSLPGRREQVQCLYYDSCENVTTSDHKPVSAVFRVAPTPESEQEHSETCMRIGKMPFFGSLNYSLRRKDLSDSACEVRLKVEFRSIQWMDAVDNGSVNLFTRLENVEFCFLFPLPCEDILAKQRKLAEVAEHLMWGENYAHEMTPPNTKSPTAHLAPPPTSNFHVVSWNKFVENGIRYSTRTSPGNNKHVAIMIRTKSNGRKRATSSRSRSRTRSRSQNSSGIGPPSSIPRTSSASSMMSTPARSFTSSSSLELTLGHGTFCIERMDRRQDTIVPLTLGGNLVGRLQVRVTLESVKDFSTSAFAW